MSRLRGRSPYGERCRAAIPHQHWKTTTVIGALRLSGMTAPMVLDGALSANAFRAYIRQARVPTRMPGDIFVIGNVPANKNKGCEKRLKQQVASSFPLLPIAVISIPSKTPLPSARRFYEPRQSAACTHCGTHSQTVLPFSSPKNRVIILKYADTTPRKTHVY